jgi:hypothetical protein
VQVCFDFMFTWYMIIAVRDFQATKEPIASTRRKIDDTLQTSDLPIKFSFDRWDLPNQTVSVVLEFTSHAKSNVKFIRRGHGFVAGLMDLKSFGPFVTSFQSPDASEEASYDSSDGCSSLT